MRLLKNANRALNLTTIAPLRSRGINSCRTCKTCSSSSACCRSDSQRRPRLIVPAASHARLTRSRSSQSARRMHFASWTETSRHASQTTLPAGSSRCFFRRARVRSITSTSQLVGSAHLTTASGAGTWRVQPRMAPKELFASAKLMQRMIMVRTRARTSC